MTPQEYLLMGESKQTSNRRFFCIILESVMHYRMQRSIVALLISEIHFPKHLNYAKITQHSYDTDPVNEL